MCFVSPLPGCWALVAHRSGIHVGHTLKIPYDVRSPIAVTDDTTPDRTAHSSPHRRYCRRGEWQSRNCRECSISIRHGSTTLSALNERQQRQLLVYETKSLGPAR